MTADSARAWIIKASLALTTGVFAFLIVGSAVGYPLDPGAGDLVRLLEILIPVFVGYLGAAAHFVFRPAAASAVDAPLPPNAVLLIKWPIFVWTFICVIAFAAFGWTNRLDAPAGIGWSVDMLAGIITATLSLQAATTNIAVAYLFSNQATPAPVP